MYLIKIKESFMNAKDDNIKNSEEMKILIKTKFN